MKKSIFLRALSLIMAMLMLTGTALSAVYATARTASSVAVWAGKATVNANLIESFSVFFSKITA